MNIADNPHCLCCTCCMCFMCCLCFQCFSLLFFFFSFFLCLFIFHFHSFHFYLSFFFHFSPLSPHPFFSFRFLFPLFVIDCPSLFPFCLSLFPLLVCESMSNVDRTRTRMHTHEAVAAVSAVAAAEQQPEGWRFVPDTILPGYQWALQWVPGRTPTVHWGPISGKAVGGPNTVQHSRSQCEKHPKHGSGA